MHGWELRGSGSNEYTRYLARALVRQGHEVQVLTEQMPAAYTRALGQGATALF